MAPYLSQLLSLLPPLFIFSPANALILHGSTLSSSPFPKHEPRYASSCRCFPGDPCWPTPVQWKAFNSTLGGKLIATIPIAAACHHDSFTPYDVQKCDALQNIWFYPETHIDLPSSIMAQYFTNNSCNPFLPDSAPCTIGNYVSYSVNASDASDYQKTIAFTRQYNIRLVIKNTGHDYNGKSTGAGAVAIWTHNIKAMEVIDYHSSYYTGKAMKMGAGVAVHEAYEFADTQDVLVVGGNCPTVGLVGGYTQGGGHGPLASKFGLGADQVLEWEVVTGTGQLVTATRRRGVIDCQSIPSRNRRGGQYDFLEQRLQRRSILRHDCYFPGVPPCNGRRGRCCNLAGHTYVFRIDACHSSRTVQGEPGCSLETHYRQVAELQSDEHALERLGESSRRSTDPPLAR